MLYINDKGGEIYVSFDTKCTEEFRKPWKNRTGIKEY